MTSTGESKHPGRRLVLFSSPFQGHINPMLQLASLLHTRGFSIIILHPRFNSPDTTNHPYFQFVSIPDGLSDQLVSSVDTVGLIEVLNTNCEEPFRDQMTRMMSDNLREPISCVIVDAAMYCASAVVKRLGLPMLVLRTSSVTCFRVFMAFPMLWEKGYLPIEDSQRERPVTELPPLQVRDLPHVNKNPQGVRRVVTQMVDIIRASSGVIFNTFDTLERADIADIEQELSIPVFSVGPLHKLSPNTFSSLLAPDQSCMEWLDKQAPESVLYVSFGSLACMDENELIETAWSLANSHQPFLWVLREDSVRGVKKIELPEELEEEIKMRGKIVKWAPQKKVLAHPGVGGFFTHSGWNSTMESICEGVPMLCWPCFGDQWMNARFVCQVWKVGIQLENGLERGEVEGAIRRLMTDREGNELRERAKTLKQNADHCIQEGGSSHETLQKLDKYLVSF